MSRYYGGWAPYVPVAERRARAERAMEQRRKAGQKVAPVRIAGRAIAATFWGQAWCDSMESYHDYENRLPRGRTYVRNGSVVDLQIAPGKVTAVVSGSELYDVVVTIKATPPAQWRAICADCAGGIDSLVELLQGRFSKGVMERLCRQQGGLFPRPSEIRFSCSCPDHALMCKHVAAVLYGVGARLDQQPELLFRLRAVDAAELVAQADAAVPAAAPRPAAGRVLETDDMAALFGLDMAAAELPPPQEPSAKKAGAKKASAKKASARKPPSGKAKATAAKPAAATPPGVPAPAKAAAASGKTPAKPVISRRQAASLKAAPAKPPAAQPAAAVRAPAPKPVKWW